MREMFKLVALLIVCCVAAAWAAPEKSLYNLDLADHLFEEFINKYQREYASEDERQKRFEIFRDNLKEINKRNMRSKTATFGINRFGDMTHEEFRQRYTCFTSTVKNSYCPAVKNISREPPPPASFDWRDQNKVTRVKDQGGCGSCWAFSTAGNVEAQYAIKHNQLIEFSEQQLVDCDSDADGCQGGFMEQALAWLRDHGGIMSEQDYPYTGRNGNCQFDKNKAVATISECQSYDGISEEDLKQVLFSKGPLSIGVDATDLDLYTSGILDNCKAGNINHGVLLVGYGTEKETPFWIIKNSWGEDWGEKGYVRVKMNENACNMRAEINSAVVN